MAKILAFANQKGGVGKTTTAIHLAAAVAERHYRVLLVDMDPQGNLASGLGIRKTDVKNTVYHALIGKCAPEDAIVPTNVEKLSLMPSHLSLVGVEAELSGTEGRTSRLSSVLSALSERFDYIFIDCPPSLSLLTVNALVAANAVLVPMTCDFYALEGLSQLTISLKKVRSLYNPSLDLVGILLTMHQSRLTLTQEVVTELKKRYSEKLFKTAISRSVRLAEAPGFGSTVFVSAPASKSAKEYRAVAKELMMRI